MIFPTPFDTLLIIMANTIMPPIWTIFSLLSSPVSPFSERTNVKRVLSNRNYNLIHSIEYFLQFSKIYQRLEIIFVFTLESERHLIFIWMKWNTLFYFRSEWKFFNQFFFHFSRNFIFGNKLFYSLKTQINLNITMIWSAIDNPKSEATKNRF